MRVWRLFGLVAILVVFFASRTLAASKEIDFFYSDACPHCKDEIAFLQEKIEPLGDIKINYYEVSSSPSNMALFKQKTQELNIKNSGVPLTIIGDRYVVGFLRGVSDVQILNILGLTERTTQNQTVGEICQIGQDDCHNILVNLPLIGEVDLKKYSLPALTVLLGALDGFNPCAMWTLLLLIGLLLGMQDRRRMWILGGTFILISGLTYFVFMAAWLNLLLFVGFIFWIRTAIGVLALGAGLFYFREFLVKKESGCEVTSSEQKQKIFQRLKETISKKSLIVSLSGLVILAVGVNMVELLCSAGLPAIYTQVLALSSLDLWQYYLYLGVYILFYMLDDLAVFILAMATLKMTALTTKYVRWSRLIGAILLTIIGVILLVRPGYLMFG